MPASVGLLAALFALAYSLYGLFRHWHFGSSAYDLGIFDQAVWHLSRFEAPASTIVGFGNILGDHFYPIVALWAPMYWLAPYPETLIVTQAIVLAASIVPVFLYARDRLPSSAAYLMAVAYGLFWGLQRTMAFDVHEMAFAPLVIATAILAMDRRQWRLFWAAAGVLVLIKEDLIPLLAGFGLYLWLRGERRRGAGLVLAAIVIFLVVIQMVIPAFNDAGVYAYAQGLGPLLREPWTIPLAVVTPAVKLATLFMWLAPFLFLPLASPLVIAAAPVILERFLSPSPNHWGTAFHYTAPLAPVLAMAAADGLARLTASRPRLTTRATAAMVILCSLLPGGLPLWRLWSPAHYRDTEVSRTAGAILAMVPADASVVAQAAIVPHLSQRRVIYMLDDKAPDADYVVAHDALSPWPMASIEEIRRLVRERERRGYALVASDEGWTVLRRSTNAARPSRR